MAVVKTTQSCPECREKIKLGAKRCKHCGAQLSSSGKSGGSLGKRLNTFRFGFVSGFLFTAVLVILVYFHFLPD